MGDPQDSLNRTQRQMSKIAEAVEEAEENASAISIDEQHEETNIQNENNEHWNALEQVNDTLRQLDSVQKTGILTEYVSGEATSEDFGFGGFSSVSGRVVEHYVTELANELDISGGQYRFGEDNGAVKTSIGYTLGAKPDAGDYSFSGLDDIPEENLEEIGEVIGTVTESQIPKDAKTGKYIEAFQLYAETDMAQKEIAEQTELDPASVSRRKQAWEDAGLVEDGEYTETGEVMSEMIDQIYQSK